MTTLNKKKFPLAAILSFIQTYLHIFIFTAAWKAAAPFEKRNTVGGRRGNQTSKKQINKLEETKLRTKQRAGQRPRSSQTGTTSNLTSGAFKIIGWNGKFDMRKKRNTHNLTSIQGLLSAFRTRPALDLVLILQPHPWSVCVYAPWNTRTVVKARAAYLLPIPVSYTKCHFRSKPCKAACYWSSRELTALRRHCVSSERHETWFTWGKKKRGVFYDLVRKWSWKSVATFVTDFFLFCYV